MWCGRRGNASRRSPLLDGPKERFELGWWAVLNFYSNSFLIFEYDRLFPSFWYSWWIQPRWDWALNLEIRKKNSNAVIHRIWIKPLFKSRFVNSLCCLQCIPLIRPINEVDVARLENEFVMDYRDGDRALYVSLYNNLNELSMSPMTSTNLGVHYVERPMRNLMSCCKMTLTLVTFLTRCSMCGRESSFDGFVEVY